MKKFITIVLLFFLVCGSFAQKDTVASRGKIRPSVEVFAGYPVSKFYHRKDFFNRTPYSAGVFAGISLPNKKGYLTLHTGFILEGSSMENVYENNLYGNHHYYHTILLANFPAIIGYDGYLNNKLSLSGGLGMTFTRIIKRTEDCVIEKDAGAKPSLYDIDFPDSWNDMLTFSVVGRFGFSYWFHPRFALKTTVEYKHYFCEDWIDATLLKPVVTFTIGISFR